MVFAVFLYDLAYAYQTTSKRVHSRQRFDKVTESLKMGKLFWGTVENNCPCWKPHDRIFIRLDKTPECDGQTDRRTDRIHLAILVQRSAFRAMRTRCENVDKSIGVLLGVLGAAAPPNCWRSRKFSGCRKFLGVGQKFL